MTTPSPALAPPQSLLARALALALALALARDLYISLPYARSLMADLNAGRLDAEPWLLNLVVESLCRQRYAPAAAFSGGKAGELDENDKAWRMLERELGRAAAMGAPLRTPPCKAREA